MRTVNAHNYLRAYQALLQELDQKTSELIKQRSTCPGNSVIGKRLPHTGHSPTSKNDVAARCDIDCLEFSSENGICAAAAAAVAAVAV